MRPSALHPPAACLRIGFALVLLGAAPSAAPSDFLERADEVLSLRLPENQFQLQVSGLLDLEGYFIDQRPPGLIFTDDSFLFNPRLSIFIDAQWTKHLYFFGQVRLDRKFDPSDSAARAELAEYFLRYTPLDNSRINFQFGKFATVVGNWVPRHYSWDNPFINAPLPYENLTGIWDRFAPRTADTLLDWGHVGKYDDGDYSDKYLRLPIVWGPDYATGFAITGVIGKFDYAAEMTNAALASHPESWNITDRNFDYPTFSGRLGLRPNEMWNVGFSASAGPYLLPEATMTLPPDRSIGDYREFVLAQDISFAWHHLQLWAECYEARFQVPNIGDADTLSYYIEVKYKITPQLFGAVRWNQQLYGTVRGEDGERLPWGNDVWRVDAAVGYRFTNYLQAKVQYSFTDQDSRLQVGEQLVAGQITLKF